MLLDLVIVVECPRTVLGVFPVRIMLLVWTVTSPRLVSNGSIVLCGRVDCSVVMLRFLRLVRVMSVCLSGLLLILFGGVLSVSMVVMSMLRVEVLGISFLGGSRMCVILSRPCASALAPLS